MESYYDENDRFCVRCGDKRRATLGSEGNNGLKESKRPKSLDEFIKEKGKEKGGFFKLKFLQNGNRSSKSNRKAPNSRAELVINVGLIEANEKGIVSIKRGNRLATKIAKKFSSIEVARAAVKKHADHEQFFCGSDEYVLCYPDQKIGQFIPGTNIEFTVERYKEEIGKPYLKIDSYLCNVSNVDSDVNSKFIDDKVTIHDNSNQTIFNQLTHEQNTDTNPTQKTNIPSILISEGQQEVRENPSNYENGFENLFPSINFNESLTGSD